MPLLAIVAAFVHSSHDYYRHEEAKKKQLGGEFNLQEIYGDVRIFLIGAFLVAIFLSIFSITSLVIHHTYIISFCKNTLNIQVKIFRCLKCSFVLKSNRALAILSNFF